MSSTSKTLKFLLVINGGYSSLAAAALQLLMEKLGEDMLFEVPAEHSQKFKTWAASQGFLAIQFVAPNSRKAANSKKTLQETWADVLDQELRKEEIAAAKELAKLEAQLAKRGLKAVRNVDVVNVDPNKPSI